MKKLLVLFGLVFSALAISGCYDSVEKAKIRERRERQRGKSGGPRYNHYLAIEATADRALGLINFVRDLHPPLRIEATLGRWGEAVVTRLLSGSSAGRIYLRLAAPPGHPDQGLGLLDPPQGDLEIAVA